MKDKKTKVVKSVRTTSKKEKTKQKMLAAPVKKEVAASPKKKPVTQAKKELLPAYKIVEILNIPDFDYFMMKDRYNFDNGAVFTVADFKKMYRHAILEGR